MSDVPPVPCSSRSSSSLTVRDTTPSTSPESRRASCSPAADASAGSPNNCASASASVDARRERLHLPLAGTSGRARQLDLDRRAADSRLREEGEIGSDGARIREVEHEALDAIRVAGQEDLAVRRRFEAADHARPLRRPGDPERARDPEAAVVVVDANRFRRRQRHVETQAGEEARRAGGGGEAPLRQPVEQPAGEDDRLAIGAAEHVDASC